MNTKNETSGKITLHFQDSTLTISGKGELSGLTFYRFFRENDVQLSVKAVIVEHGIIGIGESAFNGFSNLTSIAIPESVRIIGELAFEYCKSLKDVVVKWDVPPKISTRVFRKVLRTRATLHVPAGIADAYRKNKVWGTFNIVEDV